MFADIFPQLLANKNYKRENDIRGRTTNNMRHVNGRLFISDSAKGLQHLVDAGIVHNKQLW